MTVIVTEEMLADHLVGDGPFGGQRRRGRGGLAQDPVDGGHGRHLTGIAQSLTEEDVADFRREKRRSFGLETQHFAHHARSRYLLPILQCNCYSFIII